MKIFICVIFEKPWRIKTHKLSQKAYLQSCDRNTAMSLVDKT